MKRGDLISATCKTSTPFNFQKFIGIFLHQEEVGQYSLRYTFLTPDGIKRVIDSRRATVNRYEVISEIPPPTGVG